VWEDVRNKLAWQHFAHSELLEDEHIAWLDRYHPATRMSLTRYP
jgi:hypothetical protein